MSDSAALILAMLGWSGDGDLVLDAAASPWVTALLRPHGLHRLAIARPRISPLAADGRSVLLTGHAKLSGLYCHAILRWADGRTGLTARLRLEVCDDAITIGSLFGEANVQPQAFVLSGGVLALETSPLVNIAVANAAFETASDGDDHGTFTGDIDLTGTPLAVYSPFPLSNPLSVTGTWKQQDGYRSFTLRGASTVVLPLPSFVGDRGLLITNEGQDPTSGTTPVSSAQLYLDVPGFAAELSAPLLQGDDEWPALCTFDGGGFTPAYGLGALVGFLGDGSAALITLPPGLDVLSDFALRQIVVGLRSPTSESGLGIDYAGALVTSSTGWTLPLPFPNAVNSVGAALMYRPGNGTDDATMSGRVFGSLTLGDPAKAGTLTLALDGALPQYSFSIAMVEAPAKPPSLGGLLGQLGLSIPSAWDLTIQDANAVMDLSQRQFRAALTLNGAIPLEDHADLSLDQLSFVIDRRQGNTAGSLGGLFSLGPDKAQFQVTAAYGTGDGWTFSGGLVGGGGLPLTEFVEQLLGIHPTWVPQVSLDALAFSYALEGGAYSASGALSTALPIPGDLFGYDLSVAAAAEVSRAEKAAPVLGWVSGTFAIHDITILLKAALLDGAEHPTYNFAVTWNAVTVAATLIDIAEVGAPAHRVLTLTLDGVTVGDIARRLAAFVDPNVTLTLDAPWNALLAIDLSGSSLNIDLKTHGIAVTIPVSLDLGFASLTSVGLVYDKSSSEGSLRFAVAGSFLGQTYPPDAPLTWDANDDPPPATPGGGNQLLDLRFLGIGQHVGIGAPSGVDDALHRIQTNLVPADDGNPFGRDVFDADAGWVIGLDATLLGFVELKMVFDDPAIYGMIVGLSGPGAKALAGLRIELSYKKVSNTVGLFHVEVAIPDAYRQFDIGAVSVTLGIVALDVYTDGGFVIDLGYPANGDYTRSFTVEAGPFIGRGGFYFGVLQAGASDRLPQATNGLFKPAITAGLGLAIGLGHTFEKGPLSAGLYVQLEALFDGVLAWFHPNDAAQDIVLYHHLQAMVGIAGQLYGSVDFGIVSASLTVSFEAKAGVTLQSFLASPVYLSVSVSVDASVKVVFVRIHFHFSMDLNQSFTIGSDSAPPWILAGGGASDAGFGYRSIYAAPRRSRYDALARLTEEYRRRRLGSAPTGWDPEKQLYPAGGYVVESVSALLAITRLAPTVTWPGGAGGSDAAPPAPVDDRQMVVTLVATTGQDGRAPLLPVIETMLRWAIDAAGPPVQRGLVDVGALAALAGTMHDPATAEAFAFGDLATLFGNNLKFDFVDHAAGSDIPGAAILPMIPRFQQYEGTAAAPSVDYGTLNRVSDTYKNALRAYFAHLANGEPKAARRVRPDMQDSFATVLFEDYFQLVTRAALAAAVDLTDGWADQLAEADTLAAVARRYPPVPATYIKPAGGTLDQCAAHFGLSTDEFAFLDPYLFEQDFGAIPAGTCLQVFIGVTPQSIGAGNADALVFRPGSYPIGPIAYTVVTGDTLGTIAGDAAALADWLATDASNAIARRPLTLRDGATASLPGWTARDPFATPIADLAAIYYVRAQGLTPAAVTDAVTGDLAAIAQFVTDINALTWTANGILAAAPGTTILVPVAMPTGGPTPSPAAKPWILLGGDTMATLAAAVLLSIDPTIDAAFPPIAAKFAPGPDAKTVAVAAGLVLTVQPGELLVELAARLLFAVDDPTFAEVIAPLAILRPMQLLMADRIVSITGTAPPTLGEQAAQLLVSVEYLAGRPGIAGQPGVFQPTPLSIHHAPQVPIEALVKRVLEAETSDGIRGQVSRFMLHGMRVPAPTPDGDGLGNLAPLYALTGQQRPLSGFAAGETYQATLSLTDFPSWIVNPDLPQLFSTTVCLTQQEADASSPAGVLAPTFPTPPRPTKLTRDVPPAWSLARRLSWLSPSSWMGLVTTPTPGIWPLPQAMLTRPNPGPDPFRYALGTLPAQPAPADQPVPVASWSFGTMIDLAIRATGTPNVYELIGADSQQRSRLLHLWQALGESDQLTLVYRPAQAAGTPPGLASPGAAAADVTLIKTNLSIETRRGAAQMGGAAPGSVAALTVAQDFARLVWECSTVGGGGYWLVVGTNADDALPASAFDANGQALIALVALAEPIAATQPLQSYQNVAVIADAIDPATTRLVATDPAAAPVPVPIVDPGIVAFELTRDAAEGSTGTLDLPADGDDQRRTEQLFQLLGYRVAADAIFRASTIGLPQGPQRPPEPMLKSPSAPPLGTPLWCYGQSLPIYRFARHTMVPDVPGLPPPSGDVYAGIALDESTQAPASASVELWFQDVYGNASHGAPADGPAVTDGGVCTLALPVRYTDAIIGVTQWPSCSAKFAILPNSRPIAPVEPPTLTVTLSFEGSTYWPGATQSRDAVATSLAKHAAQYARIYYQLYRPDVTATMATSLTVQGAPAPPPLPLAPMRAFAGTAYAYINAVASLVAPVMGGTTLAAIVGQCGAGYDALAAVNLKKPVDQLFQPATGSQRFPVPRIAVAVSGGSVADLCGSCAVAVTALQNAANTDLPLRPGTELAIDPRAAVLPVATSLDELVRLTNCGAATLIAANATRSCLVHGFTFRISVGSVTTGPDIDSIATVVASLLYQGVQVAPEDVIGRVRDRSLFLGELTVTGYIAKAGETLAGNGSRDTIARLAANNAATRDLFPAGTPVWWGTQDGVGLADETLGAYAHAFGVTPGQILSSSATMPLVAGCTVTIPGTLVFPALDVPTVGGPVCVNGAEALPIDRAAAALGSADPTLLALGNLALGGWLQPGSVTYGGVTVTLPPAVAGMGPGSPMSLTGLLAALDTAAQSLTPFDPVTAIAALCTDGQLIVVPGARFLLPPSPCALEQPLDLNGSYAAAVIPVDASLTIAREPALVDPALVGTTTARITTPVAPAASLSQDARRRTHGLLGTAQDIEAATLRLLMCSGSANPDDPALPRLSALVVGADGLADVAIDTTQPFFYALRPLYPQPVTRTGAQSPASRPLDPRPAVGLQNVDVEIWARQFLADVDTFLAAPLASRAVALPGFSTMLEQKDLLADAVAAGLWDVLDGASPGAAARRAAQNALRQALLRSCSEAYDLDVMIQISGTLASAQSSGPMRLPVVPIDRGGSGKGLILTVSKLGEAASAGHLHVSVGVGAAPDSAVALDLELTFRQLEFAIATVEQGYETSRWVNFLTDPTDSMPGWTNQPLRTIAPLVARGFPTAPQLLGQSALPTFPETCDPAEAALWTFAFSLEHASQPQDQIVFGAIFNQGVALPEPPSPPTQPDLADQLGLYANTVRADVWQRLSSADPATFAAAVGTFVAAVKAVVRAWQAHWHDDATAKRLGRLFGPDVVLRDDPDLRGYVGTLQHREGFIEAIALQGPATDATGWPCITVTIGDASYDLTGDPRGSGLCVYAFPAGVAATGSPVHYRIRLERLPIAAYQDATAAVWIIRNAQLLGIGETASRPDFVYRAPPVLFPYATAPQLVFDGPFVLPPWDPAGTAAAFDAVAAATLVDAGSDRSLSVVAIEAAYALDTVTETLPLRTPVAYAPSLAFAPAGGLGSRVVKAVTAWLDRANPSPIGRFELSLTAYSTLPGRESQPILTLNRITAQLDAGLAQSAEDR